ncbi:aminotransferase [Amycolatopsis marina]|uniref:Aminotransferase n=1 Tax=Amycolatopsis marina TaxID=490629 RepID=A0A1I0XUM5_9PSEU|nr:pyridoxal phosphate-dependent aminotransferase [Amycolatopsis marina]SFB04785.1 aminotransferase [Amycolatopsis marina]
MIPADRTRYLPAGGLAALLGAGREYGAVDLAVGTPGWPVPAPDLIEQACVALRTGNNQYENPAGNLELREQLAGVLADAGDPADPATELTITVGGSEGLCVAFLSVVDPGDEVIVLEPSYENFLGGIALAGGRPRYVRVGADWRIDPDVLAAAFGSRTRAIVLNTPNNPTGHVLSREELGVVARLCERWDTTVISDEVYSTYVFDGREHISVADDPALRARSIVIGSLSKSHAISGWRMGFLRANAAITEVLRQVHIATTAGGAGPLQRAVAEAGVLRSGDWNPAAQMQRNRDRVVAMFSRLGLRCSVPEGGCYVMADIRPFTDQTSDKFAHRLLVHGGVVVAPGQFFFGAGVGGDDFIRIAFNRPDDTLDEAERRLTRFGQGVE